jgi:hypothetical protein
LLAGREHAQARRAPDDHGAGPQEEEVIAQRSKNLL